MDDKNKDPNNDPVIAKNLKPVLSQIIDKGLYSQKGDQKSDHIADDQQKEDGAEGHFAAPAATLFGPH